MSDSFDSDSDSDVSTGPGPEATPEATPEADTDSDADEFATADALTVTRDGEGELLPQTAPTELFGRVKAKPLTYGDVEAYFGDADVASIDADVIANLIANHIIEPDLNAAAGGMVTGDWVRDELKPLAPRDLILAVLEVSDIDADVDMQGEAEAEVAFGGN